MNDKELFELCKEVYRRTARKDTKYSIFYVLQSGGDWLRQELPTEVFEDITLEEGYEFVCPIYTSDYLLEKLPHRIDSDDKRSTTGTRLVIEDQTRFKSESLGGGLDVIYSARYETTYGVTRVDGNLINCHSDTPLKALLKLVLALDDAGVKL